MKIALDSDVIISGLISSRGAGRFILKNFLNSSAVKILTSKEQIEEIKKVLQRDSFSWQENKQLWKDFQKKAQQVKLSQQKRFYSFVKDKNDWHILSAAVLSGARFLITYNLKDYLIAKIKKELDILVVRPGYFIQFQREKNKFG